MASTGFYARSTCREPASADPCKSAAPSPAADLQIRSARSHAGNGPPLGPKQRRILDTSGSVFASCPRAADNSGVLVRGSPGHSNSAQVTTMSS